MLHSALDDAPVEELARSLMQVCQCRKKRQFEMHTMCFFYTSQAGMEKKGMTAQQQHRPLRQQQQQHHPSQHEVDITLVASPTRHSHQARSSPSVSPVRAAANSVPTGLSIFDAIDAAADSAVCDAVSANMARKMKSGAVSPLSMKNSPNM